MSRPTKLKFSEGWEYVAAREGKPGFDSVLYEVEAHLRKVAFSIKSPMHDPVSWAQVGTVPVEHPNLSSSDEDGGYVDPILFLEGIYTDQADYEKTIDSLAERINSGQLEPKGRESKESNYMPQSTSTPDPKIAALKEAIISLTPERREIINLIYMEGFTEKEVADALNISRNVVKNRMITALRILYKALKQFNV